MLGMDIDMPEIGVSQVLRGTGLRPGRATGRCEWPVIIAVTVFCFVHCANKNVAPRSESSRKRWKMKRRSARARPGTSMPILLSASTA